MAQSRRKRKRAKARGDRPKNLSAWGYGGLRAEWTLISVEDAALIWQAVRENWSTEKGEAILEAHTSAVHTTEQPRRAVRLAFLVLDIDRHLIRHDAPDATA